MASGHAHLGGEVASPQHGAVIAFVCTLSCCIGLHAARCAGRHQQLPMLEHLRRKVSRRTEQLRTGQALSRVQIDPHRRALAQAAPAHQDRSGPAASADLEIGRCSLERDQKSVPHLAESGGRNDLATRCSTESVPATCRVEPAQWQRAHRHHKADTRDGPLAAAACQHRCHQSLPKLFTHAIDIRPACTRNLGSACALRMRMSGHAPLLDSTCCCISMTVQRL